MSLVLSNLKIENMVGILLTLFLLVVAGCVDNTILLEEERSDENIQATFQKWAPNLYEVYAKALESDPELGGEMVFNLTVDSNGHVVKSKIVKSNIENSNFISDINSILHTINFGPVRDEKEVNFLYPMKFIPKNFVESGRVSPLKNHN